MNEILLRSMLLVIFIGLIGCAAQKFRKTNDAETEHFYKSTEDVLDELRDLNCRVIKIENQLSCTSPTYPKTPKGPNGPMEPIYIVV